MIPFAFGFGTHDKLINFFQSHVPRCRFIAVDTQLNITDDVLCFLWWLIGSLNIKLISRAGFALINWFYGWLYCCECSVLKLINYNCRHGLYRWRFMVNSFPEFSVQFTRRTGVVPKFTRKLYLFISQERFHFENSSNLLRLNFNPLPHTILELSDASIS